jgi:hypothetical protein
MFHCIWYHLDISSLTKLTGLNMVHVPWAESRTRKYVNPNEVNAGVQLVRQFSVAHDISNVLVITPVSCDDTLSDAICIHKLTYNGCTFRNELSVQESAA